MTVAKNAYIRDPWLIQPEGLAAQVSATGDIRVLKVGLRVSTLQFAAESLRQNGAILESVGLAINSAPADAKTALMDIPELLTTGMVSLARRAEALAEDAGKLSPDMVLPIKKENLIEIADGTTDLAVTNAGFGLAFGISPEQWHMKLNVQTDVFPASAALRTLGYDKVEQVDPWSMQAKLMRASGQHLPKHHAEVNKGVFLYAALNLEEGSETLLELAKAFSEDMVAGGPYDRIRETLEWAHEEMKTLSLQIRATLAKMPDDLAWEVPTHRASGVISASLGLMSANARFALSIGIPGSACYREVVNSNLSKVNPDTGVIDKTPDGKWIKGRAFKLPNLEAVLFPSDPTDYSALEQRILDAEPAARDSSFVMTTQNELTATGRVPTAPEFQDLPATAKSRP